MSACMGLRVCVTLRVDFVCASHVADGVGRSLSTLSWRNQARLSLMNEQQIQREVRIHSSLRHPNIVKLYAAFEDAVGVYLVLEYCPRGDWFQEMRRMPGGRLSEQKAATEVVEPILRALQYLHSRGVCHRDVKPENILIGQGGVPLLADFGLSIDVTAERPCTRLGTLDYMCVRCAGAARERAQSRARAAVGADRPRLHSLVCARAGAGRQKRFAAPTSCLLKTSAV